MIAWTVLSILALIPLCLSKPALRSSHRELFKCDLTFISIFQAQEAVKLGCMQLELAPPTSRFPASFIKSELFDQIDVVLFTWPVFPSNNVLRDDYGPNRVVFDSSCRLVGLVEIKSNGPKPCLHFMEAEDLKIGYKLEVYNTPFKNLPLYGYRYEKEIYLKNAIEEFIESNFDKFHDYTYRENILNLYPNDVTNANTRVWTRTIKLGPRGIEIRRLSPHHFKDISNKAEARENYTRRLIVNSYKQIIGISRKAWKNWIPLSELRSLDDAYRMKVFLEREPDMSNEPMNDINYKGIHLSAAMLKSNLHRACKILTEKMIGTNMNYGYPHLTNLGIISDKPIMTWPLRMPETFVHDENGFWLVLDTECNLIGVTS